MSGRFFLDTNVLVYTFDHREPAKLARARELVAEALRGQGMISTQIVQEFLNVARRKFEQPLSSEECRSYLDGVLEPLCEVFPTIDLYHRGLELMDRWKYGFFDSMVLAAALAGGCRTLMSEDLQHGQVIEGLTIVNPFRHQAA